MNLPEPYRRRIIVTFRRPAPKPAAFDRSLEMLLKAALREYNADTACLYRYSGTALTLEGFEGPSPGRPETASLELSVPASTWLMGLRAPAIATEARVDVRTSELPEVLFHRLTTVMVAPVRSGDTLQGIVTAGWSRSRPSVCASASTQALELIAESASLLLNRSGEVASAVDLIAKITRLESDLADSKITERAHGLLTEGEWSGQSVSALSEHIHRVLDAQNATRNLRQELSTLEARTEERRLLAEAKLRVQETLHVSEEEAYHYLRNASRRSRRPLREIAREVLADNPQQSPTLAQAVLTGQA